MATQYTAGLTTGQVLTAATMNSIGAAWETWTPQLWQGANVTSTINYAKYTRIQKLVVVNLYITATAAGTAANFIEIRNLPVTAANTSGFGGSFVYLDAGAQYYAGFVIGRTTTSVGFYFQGGVNLLGLAVTLANTDYISANIVYEAA